MKLENFIYTKSGVAKLNADDKVTRAAELMKEYHCGNVIVERDNKAIGILTDRDIAIRCLAEGNDPGATRVEECMTPDPVTLASTASGHDALTQMKEKGISRIIVVGSSQEPKGVVSADDLLKYIASELEDLACISKGMKEREHKAA